MNSGTPILKDLVLVGGGHSHVGVIKSFGMEPMPGVRVTVISRDAHAPYSGMLPGLIAGHYTFDETHIDLRPLAQFAGARFLHDEVVGIDPQARLVHCRDRPPVPYDVLSINIGSTPGLRVPGAADAVVPVKPIDSFWRRWEELRDRCLQCREETHIAVVGAGAGGVELLLSVQYRLSTLLAEQGRSASHLKFHLVTTTHDILPTHNLRVRAKFERVLAERGVEMHAGSRVAEVARGDDLPRGCQLRLGDGRDLDVDEVLWVTTARAAAWPQDSGLDVDDRGFIRVRDTLQTRGFDDIFAAGDIAAVDDHPRPKAGVFAVRQGPPLTENLRNFLVGEAPDPFRPQSKFLSLVSTGDRNAVASRGEWAAEGAWVWRWKDGIDRRFMEKFNDLPEMDASDVDEEPVDARLLDDAGAAELARSNEVDLRDAPQGLSTRERALEIIATPAMRCGGCGAKVGAGMLSRVLAELQPVGRDDVVCGLNAPDDAAIIDVPAGKHLVQSIDFFRAFIDDPYVLGKVAVNHALGDVFAMGAEPQSALATITVPYGLEAKVEADLVQVMGGALQQLNMEDTALVGGHTAEGAELAVGFAVNGLVGVDAAIGKGGMRPGDAVILTKALGTGALFAADMRGRAKGRWIESALKSMTQSNRAAAECLVEHGVTAMTDVTGFGVLGHLLEMIRASDVEASMSIGALPLLDGASEVAAAGLLSSLQSANVRLRRAVANVADHAGDPAYPFLFDPQTAGGLLATVPGDNVDACVNALRARGYGRAVAIGKITAGDAGDAPVTIVD